MNKHDVIVVGGGPAGSTSASLLAMEGHDVLLLEREVFPRFHVGESLLPSELSVFEKLDIDVGGVPGLHKQGADFLDEAAGKCGRFFFAEGLEGTREYAWQVERALFDKVLLDRSAELGARVVQGTAVLSTECGTGGVTVTTAEGAHEARYLIDATGRDRLLSKKHSSFERIDGMGLAAVWGHFDGLRPERRAELEKTGNIIVLMLKKGWGWVIPLVGGRMSVGFVSAERGVVSHEWYEEEYAASPFLQRMTEGATRTDLRMMGDFSYKNTTTHGERWACVGDSGGFLDPVFSSGVALAMAGAEKLADILSPALRAGTEAAPGLMAPLATHMEHAYAVFEAVLRSFYHTNLVDNLFFYDDPDPKLRAGLISILAGDVWRDDNDFQKMILRRSAKRFRRSGRA